MKVVFISDFYSKDLLGGAELNDSVLIRFLSNQFEVICVHSHMLTYQQIIENEVFIVSNFANLSEQNKKLLQYKKYIIYEHDHKYVVNRDPSIFVNFKIPQHMIINEEFYKNAYKVIVLSKICKQILENNLRCDNVVSIGTSLWSKEKFDYLKSLSENIKKIHTYGVIKSKNPIKGTSQALQYCEKNNITPYLINSQNEKDFLFSISKIENLIFIPQVLETFNRLVVEAKILECKVLTNPKKIGFFSEDISKLAGKELLECISKRVDSALDLFSVYLREMFSFTKNEKIAFIGKFDNLYDEEAKARSLEDNGFNVFRFDERTFERSALSNKKILFDLSPNYVFFTKLRIPSASVLIDECKKRDIKTVCWVPDLYFGIEREKEIPCNPIFKSDFIFTPDGGNQERFESLGINHHCVRQGISSQYICDFINEEKKYDIVFIGTLQKCHGPRRAKLLKFLEETYGDRFFWFGKAGDNQYRGEKLKQIYQNSKIVIGDCVPSDFYWSNRVYEAAGRGSFLLHPYIEGLEREFEDEKNIVFFELDNFIDLKEKIDFYLQHPEKRKQISKNAFKKVKENYLIDNRTRQIMEIIK